MLIKLIIFDLDGTLVDSCKDITQALNYCFEKRGITGFSSEEVKKIVGEGVDRLIEKALEVKKVSFPMEEMIECFINYYQEHITDFSTAYPDVKATLEKLGDFKKVVISNKLTILSIKTLESLNLLNYFDFVGGSDLFLEKKPSPVPILKMIKKFNVSRDKTLVVGDSELDIKAGKAAGVKTVAVTYGYRERELLNDADFIIDKFSDLVDIVKRKSV